MPSFRAEIDVMPLEQILDPQGKAVRQGLGQMQIEGITDVRIGRHVTLTIEAPSHNAAQAQVETACQKLLANAIMERYTYQLAEIE